MCKAILHEEVRGHSVWCLCACIPINEALHKGPRSMKHNQKQISKTKLAVEDECGRFARGLFIVNMDSGFGCSEPAALKGLRSQKKIPCMDDEMPQSIS